MLRVVDPGDAEILSRLQKENRAHLAPWSPLRDEHWLSAEGQLELIERRLVQMVEGCAAVFVVLDDGEVVGEITLDGIVRGPFQNGHVGYWLAEHATGRGLMTRAVEELAAHAFDVMGLHRLQAGTLVHNAASRAVLRRCGFSPYGTAPRYLRIQGRWQDHVLFQRLAHDESLDP
ncbi:GNAT family N-acetyltransferase [Aeromicrobium halocynthiae]|uniref:GNAT family N-acetyltransferase n=1 Tax=Aeromicrobium halocynthiae TaxID=560557 RepID=A0ABN2VXY4_9ACTN